MKYLVLVFASVVILLGCTSTPSMENYTNDPDRMWEEGKKLSERGEKLLTRGEKLQVSALTKAKFLLISGKPIGEPIARGGPFVMNTKEEILKAVQDYHNGTFVA